MSLKHFIGKKLDKSNGLIKRILQRANNEVFHQDLKYKYCSFGEMNPDKTFYIIRPTSKIEGLLSLFFMVMRNIAYAEENGFIPIVDFLNYETQYNCDRLINNTHNAWEYYFKQVSDISLDEVYKSKNVFVSGWGRPDSKCTIFKNDYSEEINNERKTFIAKYTGIQETINEKVIDFCEDNFTEEVLGVYVRGTDYLRLRPKGHPIQPPLEDVMEKVKEYVGKYNIKKIFLVTEDYGIFEAFKKSFGEMVFSSDDFYIKDYKDDFLYSCLSEKDPFEKGANYLIKMLILAKCPYLVSTLTNGSLFSLAISENEFKDKYIFNIGKY